MMHTLMKIVTLTGTILLCALMAGLILALLIPMFIGPFFGYWTAFFAGCVVAFIMFCVWSMIYYLDHY